MNNIAVHECVKKMALTFLFPLLFIMPQIVFADAPELLLAKIYNDDIGVTQYLVSEKFDGVRAVWDGKTLTTRQGNPIAAPAWFIANFPKSPLDGELWIARGAFDQVSGVVRSQSPVDADWRQVSYLIFELPNGKGDFSTRYQTLKHIIATANVKHLKLVKQFKVNNKAALKQKMVAVIALKGEGLMLHRANALYETGRSDVLLKLKPYLDAEAKVIAHLPGKGKYAGKMGSLLVELPDGVQFKLGTGFSDAERAHPPAIGSTVRFIYQHKTKTGQPRFARFLRIRQPSD
jgi:DNA ligase-1